MGAPPEAPFPPRCLSRFRPVHALAEGGYGEVWLAFQVALNRQVVVKVLSAQSLSRHEDVARFEDEARITAALVHPHIVRVIDHDVEEGVPWIAYEHLPGLSLAEAIARGALPLELAIEPVMQVARALQAAHDRGVLHRDVKPANVIQSAEGHWKVADFGIAKWAGGSVLTQSGMIIGTPAYLSPEQVRGEPATPRSDLYALGVMLFETLTGRVPFEADDPVSTLTMHLRSPVPQARRFRPDLPEAVQEVLERALAKEPGARYPSAMALESVLANLVRRPLQAGLASGRSATAAPAPRRRGVPGAALAGGALALAAVATALVSRPAPARVSAAPAIPTSSASSATPATPAPLLPSAAGEEPASPPSPADRALALAKTRIAEVLAKDRIAYDEASRIARACLAEVRPSWGALAGRKMGVPLCRVALPGVRHDAEVLAQEAHDLWKSDVMNVAKVISSYAARHAVLVEEIIAIAPPIMSESPPDYEFDWHVAIVVSQLLEPRLITHVPASADRLQHAVELWAKQYPEAWTLPVMQNSADRESILRDDRRHLARLLLARERLAHQRQRYPIPAVERAWVGWLSLTLRVMMTAAKLGLHDVARDADQEIERTLASWPPELASYRERTRVSAAKWRAGLPPAH